MAMLLLLHSLPNLMAKLLSKYNSDLDKSMDFPLVDSQTPHHEEHFFLLQSYYIFHCIFVWYNLATHKRSLLLPADLTFYGLLTFLCDYFLQHTPSVPSTCVSFLFIIEGSAPESTDQKQNKQTKNFIQFATMCYNLFSPSPLLS